MAEFGPNSATATQPPTGEPPPASLTDVNSIPCTVSPLTTRPKRSVLRAGSSRAPANSPVPSGRRNNMFLAGGLSGFRELPPHEERDGVRGDEGHEFAWPSGSSFLAALDIARPAMPVRHTHSVKDSRIRRSLHFGIRHRGQPPGLPLGVTSKWRRRGDFQCGGEKNRSLFDEASARLGRQKRPFLCKTP